MASSPPPLLGLAARQLPLDPSQDPRIGSGRDDSDGGGTLSHLSAGNSASLAGLGSTFIPVAVFSAVCLLVFLVLRRRCHRAYAPRTLPGIPVAAERSPPLPSGWFDWIRPFYAIDDTFVLNNSSVDGFFFLRYLKVLATICAAGLVVVWPVLLPLHGTGGRNLTQLELLTIGNVVSPSKFYAHAFVSWCFFGFILFMISRECVFYINMRQAYLLSPNQAHRLSSRTVLFTCVPQRFLDEARIRKLFGDEVKNVWIPRNTKALAKLVEEREKAAAKLELAEIQLIKIANAAREGQLRSKNPPVAETSEKPAFSPSSPDATPRSRRVLTKSPGGVRPSSAKGKFHEELDVRETAVPASQQSTATCSSPAPPAAAELVDDEEDGPDGDSEYRHPYGLDPSLPDVRGSVAAQWVPASARPSHRPLANFGRRVDTIRYTRQRIKTLNAQIARLRKRFRAGNGTPLSAVFVEFDTQASAQVAYQVLAHHQPLHMSPRFIGIRPEDVVWPALRMRWWERIMRRFLINGLVAVAVVFWSAPSAAVGIVSNIKFLSSTVPFLGWIDKLPSAVVGVIQGLMPALALSMLMAVVPIGLRACARAAGVPSRPMVELFTQNTYFVFQVVQVFLVTTLTSAASAAFGDIIQNPLSAKDLLSQNLPKSSNFYLSYILVQCLAGGSWGLMHFVDLFRHHVLARKIEHPRRLSRNWFRLREIHWGAVFPVFTNMAVIAICYSCIAPLVLVFAGLGMLFTYVVYKYNLVYSFDSDLDTKGLVYPRALMQLMFGLYLAEICLIGLFSLQSAFGPVLLMLIFLVFTALVHMSLSDAVSPLLYNLPRTLALDDKDLAGDDEPAAETGQGAAPGSAGQGAAAEYYDMEEGFGETEEDGGDVSLDANAAARDTDGGGRFFPAVKAWAASKFRTDPESEEDSAFSQALARLKKWTTPDPTREPNVVTRFLHPEIYEDSRFLRPLVADRPPFELPGDYARRGYWPTEMWLPPPRLWIPRDAARVSRQEVAHTRGVLPISDRGAWLDENGRVVADMSLMPFLEPRMLH